MVPFKRLVARLNYMKRAVASHTVKLRYRHQNDRDNTRVSRSCPATPRRPWLIFFKYISPLPRTVRLMTFASLFRVNNYSLIIRP